MPWTEVEGIQTSAPDELRMRRRTFLGLVAAATFAVTTRLGFSSTPDPITRYGTDFGSGPDWSVVTLRAGEEVVPLPNYDLGRMQRLAEQLARAGQRRLAEIEKEVFCK